jgi:ATP-dependent DNA helicase DinG
MALNVAESLEGGKPVLIEAGTGIGKSLAYLVPAICWASENRKRVVVSTYTKALQDQLFTKDLPALREVLGADFSYSCLFGAENYVSLRRMHRAYGEAKSGLFPAETGRGLEALVDWAKTTRTGLRMELERAPSLEAWMEARRDPDDCLGKDCPHYRECFYFRARRQALESHILVVNHSLLFAGLASGRWVLPRPDALILDEAHTMEDVASESAGMRVTRGGALRLMSEIAGGPRGPGLVARLKNVDALTADNISRVAGETRDHLDRFFQDLQRTLRGKRENAYRLTLPLSVPQSLLRLTRDLSAYLREGHREVTREGDAEEAVRIRSYVTRVETLGTAVKELAGTGAEHTVYWAEKGTAKRGPAPIALRSAPLEVGPYLRENLFVDGLPVVLTSATLTVARSFEHFRRRLGLEGLGDEFRYLSPFDYAARSLLYVPREMPDPKNEAPQFSQAIADKVLEVLRVTSGATMVLCTSYDTVRRVKETVRAERPELTVLSQDEGGAGSLLRKFRKTKGAVLVGTASFWQGVDLPGESLICVVVTRLPFEVPDNPVVEARCEWIEQNGGNAFLEYSLPSAVLMFRQGFGRLIRTKTDWGVVAVLDPRLNTRRYGRMFTASLPPIRMLDNLREVAAFVARHRPTH